jgi:hypothetical protein
MFVAVTVIVSVVPGGTNVPGKTLLVFNVRDG